MSRLTLPNPTVLIVLGALLISACGPRHQVQHDPAVNQFNPAALVGETDFTVKINGLRSSQGLVLVSVCADPNCEVGRDKDPSLLYAYKIGIADKNGVTMKMHGFQKGKYAFNLLHDENSSMAMDLDPKTAAPLEGYGYSRKFVAIPDAPKFADIAVDCDGVTPQEISLCPHYPGADAAACNDGR